MDHVNMCQESRDLDGSGQCDYLEAFAQHSVVLYRGDQDCFGRLGEE
jgi:hypothetical protein